MTFRPMGHRLADVLVANLNGEFDDELDTEGRVRCVANAPVVEAEIVTDEQTA